jgi:hypothetical protein
VRSSLLGFLAGSIGVTVKPRLVETDGEGRVALPNHPNKRFLLRDSEDGSILLQPATAVTEAQHEYEAALTVANAC